MARHGLCLSSDYHVGFLHCIWTKNSSPLCIMLRTFIQKCDTSSQSFGEQWSSSRASQHSDCPSSWVAERAWLLNGCLCPSRPSCFLCNWYQLHLLASSALMSQPRLHDDHYWGTCTDTLRSVGESPNFSFIQFPRASVDAQRLATDASVSIDSWKNHGNSDIYTVTPWNAIALPALGGGRKRLRKVRGTIID